MCIVPVDVFVSVVSELMYVVCVSHECIPVSFTGINVKAMALLYVAVVPS